MERRNWHIRPIDFMKRYIAILNQTGQNAPVATVLENSLGAPIVWTRSSEGQYLGTLAGAFPAKTKLLHGDGQGGEADTRVSMMLPPSVEDYVLVHTKNVSEEVPAPMFADNLLLRTTVEILVYE